MSLGRAPLLVAFAACLGCDKVPVTNIDAVFSLADAAWFAEEQTLFVFYRLEAAQGLGPESQLEVTYRTDTTELPWTPLSKLTPVHTHLPVDCGPKGMCGSTSLKVTEVPRQVGVRFRYHRDGLMTLEAAVTLNVIGVGPPHTHRSLLVYGVFDEHNLHVEWRARHQFPTLRNQQVEELGLRRALEVSDPQQGALFLPGTDNPYAYAFGSTCPGGLTPLGWEPLKTSKRAVFDPHELPLSASAAKVLCARSTVTDAKGKFEAVAVARKNPEVRAAFPSLRSPIRDNTSIGFLLRPCAKTISKPHLEMQVQRLLFVGEREVCIDNWRDPAFVDLLAAGFRTRIDQVRAGGKDMVLVIGLHDDDASGEFAGVVEQALSQILPFERDKSTPRVSAAFVFDSYGHSIASPELRRLVLWCPAKTELTDLEKIPAASEHSCPLLPDFPDLNLGPFKFGTLPILPTRAQYLTFIAKYSEAQAGQMRELSFRAPELTPISQNVPVGDFGVASFFNDEIISAAASDAFSFCTSPDLGSAIVVFRSALSPDPIPLANLAQLHKLLPQASYGIGLLWDFPVLLRLKYEVNLAGAATAFSLTVPFGVTVGDQKYYGTELWQRGDFPLAKTLTQCTRFCDHPTFDPGGVYNVSAPFAPTYAGQCYHPLFPTPADQGFPLDP